MAKKQAVAQYREIMTSIKRGEFSNVYILMGEESYYLDSLTKALENYVVKEEDKDFNSIVYFGAEADMAAVIGSAQQYPVMSERQIVILKEAQAMTNAKTQLDKLANYVAHPNKTTVLVVVYKGGSLNSTSALLKAAKSSTTTVFKSEKLRDYELKTPIKTYCDEQGVGIDEKAIGLLCDYIGNPLSKLFGEIDKLIVAGGRESKRITPELIERNIGISKDYNTFELVKALAKKDYLKSMKIVDYFAHNPKQNPGIMIAATIFNFFAKLFIASISRDKSDSTLMQLLELKNVYALSDYRDGLTRYNARMVVGAIHAVREYDAKIKGIGSTQNEYELLKELIFRIFTTQ